MVMQKSVVKLYLYRECVILKQDRFFNLELNMFITFAEDRQYKLTNLSHNSDNNCFHFCRKLSKGDYQNNSDKNVIRLTS